MLRLNNLNLPLDADEAALRHLAAVKLRVPDDRVLRVKLIKKSVDARDKGDVHFVVTVDAEVENEAAVLKKLHGNAVTPAPKPQPLRIPKSCFRTRPVVVGAGPAGLFAAVLLARSGARPILLERGKPVEQRTLDVSAMSARGVLDPDSNVQFGEGGAGAFSDGKLTTGIKSPLQQHVLDIFVAHGAPEEILWLAKPHIGTDLLKGVVAGIREEIIALGGEVRFGTRLTGLLIRGSHIEGVTVRAGEETDELLTDTVILAIGHSARDTMQQLFNQGVTMIQKPFAIGVRIEHPQAMIDRSQYGRAAGHPALGPAPYKLNEHTPDGRGVYTFCMCPGGEVIAAASQPGGVCVNGMSYHARDGRNANAALRVGVRPEDFPDEHPLSGLVLQRGIEQAAYRLGGGDFRAPAQRVEDFLMRRASKGPGEVLPTYRPGVTWCDLHECLPSFITQDLAFALPLLDRRLKGYALPDAVMTGVETRSSSPIRIPRDAGLMAALNGLFPAGEGAGYAGGIVSAAVDGMNAALAAISRSTEL